MPLDYPGKFITLEGPDGAGKSTQLKLLSKKLEAINYAHVVSRDPGGTNLGRQIRRLLLNPDNPVDPLCELLLYEADRAQHIAEVIEPNLKNGKLVILDRFTDSTLAYQGYGRGIDLDMIKKLNTLATKNIKPDLTILFDVQSEIGLSRLHPGGQDRLEKEAIEFHHKVRSGYLELAQQEPDRFVILDASKPMSQLADDLERAVAQFCNLENLVQAV